MQAAEILKNKYVKFAAVALLVIAVIYAIYYYGKKAAGVTITSDTGTGPTAEDYAKADSLAQRLKDDLAGLNFGHDDSIYEALAASSNVVFALTFVRYKALTNNSLLSDINSDFFYGWSVIDILNQRATALNIN